MKTLLVLCMSILSVSVSYSQSPFDAVFKKYMDVNGADISIENLPMQLDSSVKAPLTTVLKTLEFSIDEDEKKSGKVHARIIKECNKILTQKQYILVSVDKDEDSVHKIFKSDSGTLVEICELEYDEEQVTLMVTQVSGMAERAKNTVDIKTNK